MEPTTGEHEKRLLAAAVRERLVGNKKTVLYKELLNNKIPTFLKNFLYNNVQKIIHTEEPVQFNNSKRFDFEYDKINQLKGSLLKAFEEATIFSDHELSEIINHTVGLQFDLLVKPNATLLQIFYRNKSDRNQSELLDILKELHDHRAFIQRLIENIKEFDQYHIVEDDFKKIILLTETEVYREKFVRSFISDISAFSDFLNLIYGSENNRINGVHLKLLLEERNVNHYLETFPQYQNNGIDIDKLALLFADLINSKDVKSEKARHSFADKIERSISLLISGKAPDDAMEQRSKIYRSEIEQSFKVSDSEKKPKAASKKSLDHKPPSDAEEPKEKKHPRITNTWKDPLDMIIERSQIEAQPAGPLASLKGSIDEKSEKFIIKRIFNNDEESYAEFIRQLEKIDNWKEAKKHIDNELYVRALNPFSKEAIQIGDLVFNRYFPKKH